MPDRLDDPVLTRAVLSQLDDLITRTSASLPDDERAHGWTDREWGQMLDMVTRWRDRIASRGFLSSTDIGWQTWALFDFDKVDTGYGVARTFVVIGNDIGDALENRR